MTIYFTFCPDKKIKYSIYNKTKEKKMNVDSIE